MNIFRSIFSKLKEEIHEPEVLILLGPRQVGKSTLLTELHKEVSAKKCLFVDLEQAHDLNRFAKSKAEITDWLLEYDFVFIDEFYYLPNAGEVFKAVFDHGKRHSNPTKIVASGSSSIEIHAHLKESLAGRFIKKIVYPLVLEEYLHPDSRSYVDLDTYLRFGGMPGLSSCSNDDKKKDLLEAFVSSYIFKDIKALIKEENIRAFNHFLSILADRQGQLVEVSSLASEVGLAASSVNRYLEILNQTYVNYTLNSYHTNLANELKKSKKTFLFDLGVRNSILKDFRPASEREDKGQVLESYVFQHLVSRLKPNHDLRFWRTKHQQEVDFVLIEDRQPTPIEVKSKLGSAKVPKGIRAFCSKYTKVKRTYTVSERNFEPLVEDGVEHHFIRFDAITSVFEG